MRFLKVPKHLVSESIWLVFGRLVAGLGSILVLRGLVYSLPANIYSNLVLMVAAVALFSSIAGNPLAIGLNRHYHESTRLGNDSQLLLTAWSGSILVAVVSGVIMVVLWPLFGISTLHFPYGLILILYLTCTILTNFSQAVLNIAFHRREASVVMVLGVIVAPATGIVVSQLWGKDLNMLILGYAAGNVVALSFAIILLARLGKIPSFNMWRMVSGKLLARLLIFGWPTALASIFAWITSVSDRFLINYLVHSSETVAYYAIAYQAGILLPQMASAVFFALAAPYIMRSYVPENGRLPNLEMWIGLLTWIIVPAVAFSIIFSERLILLVAPSSYLIARAVVPFSSVAFGAYSCYSLISNVYLLRNRLLLPVLFSMLAGCVNIALNLFLIPRLGFMGAAISTIVAYACEIMLGVNGARRLLYWTFPWKWFGIACGATLIGTLLVFTLRYGASLRTPSWGADLVLMMMFGLSYVAALPGGYTLYKKQLPFGYDITQPQSVPANVMTKTCV
jgi:O-antigen/teichoic acid export membrane protein